MFQDCLLIWLTQYLTPRWFTYKLHISITEHASRQQSSTEGNFNALLCIEARGLFREGGTKQLSPSNILLEYAPPHPEICALRTPEKGYKEGKRGGN